MAFSLFLHALQNVKDKKCFVNFLCSLSYFHIIYICHWFKIMQVLSIILIRGCSAFNHSLVNSYEHYIGVNSSKEDDMWNSMQFHIGVSVRKLYSLRTLYETTSLEKSKKISSAL